MLSSAVLGKTRYLSALDFFACFVSIYVYVKTAVIATLLFNYCYRLDITTYTDHQFDKLCFEFGVELVRSASCCLFLKCIYRYKDQEFIPSSLLHISCRCYDHFQDDVTTNYEETKVQKGSSTACLTQHKFQHVSLFSNNRWTRCRRGHRGFCHLQGLFRSRAHARDTIKDIWSGYTA